MKLKQTSAQSAKDRDLTGLSERAKNCFHNAGIGRTKKAIAKAILSGALDPRPTIGTRNYGWKTHQETIDWLKGHGISIDASAVKYPRKMGVGLRRPRLRRVRPTVYPSTKIPPVLPAFAVSSIDEAFDIFRRHRYRIDTKAIRDEVKRVLQDKIAPPAHDSFTYLSWCAALLAALEQCDAERRHWKEES